MRPSTIALIVIAAFVAITLPLLLLCKADGLHPNLFAYAGTIAFFYALAYARITQFVEICNLKKNRNNNQ